ncbi:MAG: DNA-deoxyinosine glycosylase [Clostridia bacterium]|nr:DNA-deoxyinosine glycosylase [Clostridia bacterium]
MRNWNGCSNNDSERAQRVIHPFAPVWDPYCRILILGSFPSVKSREQCFYYGHPQNRFWRVIAAVYNEKVPATIAEKREILLRRHIALWDVIKTCRIVGSSDASICDAVPNDLYELLEHCPLDMVILNGKTAERMYLRYWKDLGLCALTLPSTSPANAAWSLERLTKAWGEALNGKGFPYFSKNP